MLKSLTEYSAWWQWCESGLDLLFPLSCAFCGNVFEADHNNLVCADCVQAICHQRPRMCDLCAGQLPDSSLDTDSCAQCRDMGFRFERTIALGPYQGHLRRAVVQMKELRHSRLAWAVGRLLAERVRDCGEVPDVLVYTPVNWRKRWERQTCSAELLATSLGKQLNVAVARRGLMSRRRTEKQSLLPVSVRKQNVRGAFSARPLLGAPHVGLVDDTMTTGSTANELTKLLLGSGAGRVTVMLAARGTLKT